MIINDCFLTEKSLKFDVSLLRGWQPECQDGGRFLELISSVWRVTISLQEENTDGTYNN